ncbi:NAD+ synthase [Patescibacteria group bacterium]
MKVAMAQVSPVVGDIEGNLELINTCCKGANAEHCDLIVFPELCVTGYPPRDLLQHDWFMKKVDRAITTLQAVSKANPTLGILVGLPMPTGLSYNRGLYNSALLLLDGYIIFQQNKRLLPTYDVFDETRYFDNGHSSEVVHFGSEVLGISICEDAWNESGVNYPMDPISDLVEKGATILINLSASPFHIGKDRERYKIIQAHAAHHGRPFIYVNQVGGHDELIFDGGSLVFDSMGREAEYMHAFTQGLWVIDTTTEGYFISHNFRDDVEKAHDALVMGVRDYMAKTGFEKAVIGLSGGIDSALTCAIAVKALGPENVLGILMPSEFSSSHSVGDASQLAINLGIEYKIIPIEGIYRAYQETLDWQEQNVSVAFENIQARIRGNILMAFSNKQHRMVLSTGNKSELALGYCTLYGDMCGGLSVISDLPKTLVYEMARDINRLGEVIPWNTIIKPPSAELKPDQKDSDSLPPYSIIDPVLQLFIEEQMSPEEIIQMGFEQADVRSIINKVKANEYKRRQAAPGLKVTSKAFGMGRRMPIAAKY